MNALVTVVVPIYNGERYLRECLDSLVVQDYPELEIILVDDGSTDQSKSICQQYVSKDKRFQYIYQENAGPNAARKTGVEHASGDWVLFADADDFVTPDFCSNFLSMQHKTDADMVFGQMQYYQDGRYGRIPFIRFEGIFSSREILEQYIQPQFFMFGVAGGAFPILFRKSIIQEALERIDLRIRFGEDCGCTLYSLLRAHRVSFISKVVYFYRQSDSSCVHTHTKSNVVGQKLLHRFLVSVLQDTGEKKRALKKIDWLIINSLLIGGYEFFADFPGLYPFGIIPDGKRVVIYGAGVFGEEVHDKFPHNLILAGWVDQQSSYYQSIGKQVSAVEDLPKMSFDYVVIAVINPNTSEEIQRSLHEKEIPADKILKVDEKWIDSVYTKKKLQELEDVDESYCYVPATVPSSQGK